MLGIVDRKMAAATRAGPVADGPSLTRTIKIAATNTSSLDHFPRIPSTEAQPVVSANVERWKLNAPALHPVIETAYGFTSLAARSRRSRTARMYWFRRSTWSETSTVLSMARDANQQVLDLEGFAHKVIRASFHAFFEAARGGQRGDNDDRSVSSCRARPNRLAERQPIQFGHADVQKDKVGFQRECLLNGILAVNRRAHLHVFGNQDAFENFPHSRIVVDNQYFSSIHGRSPHCGPLIQKRPDEGKLFRRWIRSPSPPSERRRDRHPSSPMAANPHAAPAATFPVPADPDSVAMRRPYPTTSNPHPSTAVPRP